MIRGSVSRHMILQKFEIGCYATLQHMTLIIPWRFYLLEYLIIWRKYYQYMVATR